METPETQANSSSAGADERKPTEHVDSDIFSGEEFNEETPAQTTSPASTETPTNEDDTPVVKPETNEDGTPVVTPVATTPPAQTSSSTEDLVKQLTAAITASQQHTQQPEQKPLSEEEKRKLLNVWEPSEQDASDLLEGGEAALAAFKRMRDGLVRQAHTMAYVQQKNMIDQLRAELQPHIQRAEQAQLAQEEQQFFDQNKDLSPHKELVKAVFSSYKANNRTFKTFDEAAQTLASDVRSLLKNAGVELKTEQNPQGATATQQSQQTQAPTQSSAPTQQTMTPQPRGGQSAASGRQQQQAVGEEPPGAEVF